MKNALLTFRESRFGLALLSALLPFLFDSLFLLFTAGTYLPKQLSIVYMVSFIVETFLLVYAIITRKKRYKKKTKRLYKEKTGQNVPPFISLLNSTLEEENHRFPHKRKDQGN